MHIKDETPGRIAQIHPVRYAEDMQLSPTEVFHFQEIVWQYYKKNYRPMPWREQPTPYWVLVSEIMLQQTQVERVRPKFTAFVAAFPTIDSLAQASLGEVLQLWSGLGYNRRAKFLWQAAQAVVRDYGGVIPSTFGELTKLPGIGKNTAGAILVYAFGLPVVFIETNIRSVYLHHFFADQHDITDTQIIELLEQTLDTEHPRDWYWALMDYGTHLKQTAGNNIARSRHYTKQTAFSGSHRQLRGKVLKLLIAGQLPGSTLASICNDDRLTTVLQELEQEGFIVQRAGNYSLT
jgi:A/G-specific adenine glycosylase